MATCVVVPWRPGCPYREAAWRWLKPRYPWPVHEGLAPEGVWCKAAAVADGLTRVSADILVIADADVWSDGLAEAVAAVAAGAPWAIPHGDLHRLDEAATNAILAGGPFGGDVDEPVYRGHAGGGYVVLPRSTYDEVPLVPRFTGWGNEDDSWSIALHTLAGVPWRGTDPLFHLWHPPQPRLNRRIGSFENRRLWRRYQGVNGDVDRMRALLQEARSG